MPHTAATWRHNSLSQSNERCRRLLKESKSAFSIFGHNLEPLIYINVVALNFLNCSDTLRTVRTVRERYALQY